MYQLINSILILKSQQVNLHNPPGKVAVTCRELGYHRNLHTNNSKKKTKQNKTKKKPKLDQAQLTHQVRGPHVASTNQVW